MFRLSIVVTVAAFAILLAASGAWAVPTNYTIADTIPNATWGGGPTGVGGEDQEVESGMQTGQNWDLEAFLWDAPNRTLTMMGGWNFQTGVVDNDWRPISGGNWESGDVFLAQSLPLYGATAPPPSLPIDGKTKELFKYTLALDIGWESAVGNVVPYTVVGLVLNTTLETAVYGENGYNLGSNPYRYLNLGSEGLGSGTATFADLGTADVYGLTGGRHYSVTFDLSDSIASDGWFDREIVQTGPLWMHFTQECGNDDLMGKIPEGSIPEPMSMVMLGCLGAGMLGARKARKLRKAAK